MPWNSIKDIPESLAAIEPPITLPQANMIASWADKVEELTGEPGWGVAIGQFKRIYAAKDGKWAKKAAMQEGGPTSGNWAHKGVKGSRGGSAPGGGHGAVQAKGLGVDRSTLTTLSKKVRDARTARGSDDTPTRIDLPKPEPEPSWQKGVVDLQYTPSDKDLKGVEELARNRIDSIAEREGLTPEEAQQRIQEETEWIAEHGEVAIRVRPEQAAKIIEDGRFKSQFETQESNGAYDPEIRVYAEETGLGYPPNTPPQDRPIYGYLKSPEPDRFPQVVSAYGEIEFILKPEVKQRSTMTLGDSFEGFYDQFHAGTPINKPNILHAFGDASFKKPSASVKKATRLDMKGYPEAQIQKGVRMQDVARIVVHRTNSPRSNGPDRDARDLSRWLKDAGITGVTVEIGAD